MFDGVTPVFNPLALAVQPSTLSPVCVVKDPSELRLKFPSRVYSADPLGLFNMKKPLPWMAAAHDESLLTIVPWEKTCCERGRVTPIPDELAHPRLEATRSRKSISLALKPVVFRFARLCPVTSIASD